MRKNKIQLGTKVKVFRRCRNWWNTGMDKIVGHTFIVSETRRSGTRTGCETTGYILDTTEPGIVSGYTVSSDCLKVVG